MSLPVPVPPISHSSRQPRIAVSYTPTNELKESTTYPWKTTRKQLRKFVRHLKEFGVTMPLVVNAGGTVFVGIETFLAAKEVGITELPVIIVDHLSPEQLRVLEVAHVRLLQDGELDLDQLRSTFFELEAIGIDLELTGFDVSEIDLTMQVQEIGDGPDPADIIPETEAVPVSRLGDIWRLGRHRVLCGNALESVSYAALMAGELASAVFTDPPYNVEINGNVGGLGATHHREFAMAAGEMSEPEFRHFLLTGIRHMVTVSKAGAVTYFCMDWRHARELCEAMLGADLVLLNRCTWVKPNGGMGSFYRSRHEDVYVGRNGNTPHRNNVELGRHGRNRTNVWEYASPATFGRTGDEGRLLDLHPTVKPVALVADAILDCTARGEIVLDPFLGSGTTLIAAEKVGRRCLGMELDPLYVDTIILRWQAWTGEEAVLASTGQTFTQVAAEREVAHV